MSMENFRAIDMPGAAARPVKAAVKPAPKKSTAKKTVQAPAVVEQTATENPVVEEAAE